MANTDAVDAGKKIAIEFAGLAEEEIVKAIRVSLVVVGLDEKIKVSQKGVSRG